MTTDETTQIMDAKYATAVAALRATLDELTGDEILEMTSEAMWTAMAQSPEGPDLVTFPRSTLFALGVRVGIKSMGEALVEILEELGA